MVNNRTVHIETGGTLPWLSYLYPFPFAGPVPGNYCTIMFADSNALLFSLIELGNVLFFQWSFHDTDLNDIFFRH